MHVIEQWEEAREPKGNLCEHLQNMQTGALLQAFRCFKRLVILGEINMITD